jgi:hypothetical protein
MSNVVVLTFPRSAPSTHDDAGASGPHSSKNAIPAAELANLAGLLIDVTDKLGELLDFIDLTEDVQQSADLAEQSTQTRIQIANARQLLASLNGRVTG